MKPRRSQSRARGVGVLVLRSPENCPRFQNLFKFVPDFQSGDCIGIPEVSSLERPNKISHGMWLRRSTLNCKVTRSNPGDEHGTCAPSYIVTVLEKAYAGGHAVPG
eukprot:2896767-Rhodomonas_salina.2